MREDFNKVKIGGIPRPFYNTKPAQARVVPFHQGVRVLRVPPGAEILTSTSFRRVTAKLMFPDSLPQSGLIGVAISGIEVGIQANWLTIQGSDIVRVATLRECLPNVWYQLRVEITNEIIGVKFHKVGGTSPKGWTISTNRQPGEVRQCSVGIVNTSTVPILIDDFSAN